jgi:hypothetical protein
MQSFRRRSVIARSPGWKSASCGESYFPDANQVAAPGAVITRQAQIIAYIDDYKLRMIATLAVIPRGEPHSEHMRSVGTITADERRPSLPPRPTFNIYASLVRGPRARAYDQRRLERPFGVHRGAGH